MNKKQLEPFKKAINAIQIDCLKQSIADLQALSYLRYEDNLIKLGLMTSFPNLAIQDEVGVKINAALNSCSIDVKAQIKWQQNISMRQFTPGLKPVAGVKNIIAIASGKGGVGKSTTCVNLALALQAQGARVGVLDADIYGPNQPHMLGVTQKPQITADKKFKPVIAHGMQTMSIGYLVETVAPMIWRGPMIGQALQQLMFDTNWCDLDYLLIDLPPGTGDVQLTMAKKVPVTAAIIVTTPQDIALLDATKAYNMFAQVKVNVLGVVENMSGYTCDNCGHHADLFGHGGGSALAHKYKLPVLGGIPLDLSIRSALDEGKPTMLGSKPANIFDAYNTTALRLAYFLSLGKKSYAGKFPNIVIEEK